MEYLYLFFISFISATFFPLGSEAVFLLYLNDNFSVLLLLLVATIGNTLGSTINYWLGLKGENYLETKGHIKKEKIIKYKNFFDKYGGYSLLLSWMPIIGDPITLIAGAMRYNIKKFILLVLVAKFSRYFFLVLVYKYFI